MLKRHKDFLRAVVTELRHALAGYADSSGTWQRGDLDRELERLGIAPDGTITPLDALPNPNDAERRARYVADAQLASLQNSERIAARIEMVERAAYSWINRLLALRVMEARGLIDETLRTNPEYGGVSEALYLLRMQAPDQAEGADGGWWAVVEDACAAQAATLPGLFDPRDPAVALQPSIPALLRCVAVVGNALPGYTLEEADAAFADPDAIGWGYQFYQEEAKARTYAKFSNGGKAETRAEIASATQLFTERYMVQWLLQNGLGRSYHEAYPDSKLPDSWVYYVRRPDDEEGRLPPSVKSLSELTVMDPCMGSGHFLREAFDMLAAMYREREPGLSAAEVADRILSRHLHGVDIDPRAAQLAALTIYLRSWELVRDEQRTQRRLGPVAYRPPTMNLASTPTGLSAGAMERHLRRHPEDLVFKPLLEGIFAALEKADLLGSLLQPGAQLDGAIAKLQQPHTITMDFDADQTELRRTIADLANRAPAELKRMLLDRIAASFAAEVGGSDVGADLFGREAEQGVRLLELLDRRYSVVVTNPPYMGSGNMGPLVRTLLEKRYPAGRYDLYASLMLRCIALAWPSARVAMVTQQSWMLQRNSADLRAVSEQKLQATRARGEFAGILRDTCIEVLAHLGPGAFEEIGGHVVQSVLFVLKNHQPGDDHQVVAFRLVGVNGTAAKAAALREGRGGLQQALGNVQHFVGITTVAGSGGLYVQENRLFLSISESPLAYWLSADFLHILATTASLGTRTRVVKGISTSSESRFIRFHWEVDAASERWFAYAKGGGYRRWQGLERYCFDWQHDGSRLKVFNTEWNDGAHWSKSLRNVDLLGHKGIVCSRVAGGNLAFRVAKGDHGFDSTAIFVSVTDDREAEFLLAILNSRVATYLLRSVAPSMVLESGYVGAIPIVDHVPYTDMSKAVSCCIQLAGHECSLDPTERGFQQVQGESWVMGHQALRHLLEGVIESEVFASYHLQDDGRDVVVAETGAPCGWLPLLAGYDALPMLSEPVGMPGDMRDRMATHDHVGKSPEQLAGFIPLVRAAYEAGPESAYTPSVGVGSDNESLGSEADAVSLTKMPTETFLERLAIILGVHPVSVYWLLQELRAEGVRSKPEEQRLLEDRLSVLLLRLLGHRWPKQIDSGEPIAGWAGCDGIIPITPGVGESTAAERLRERLRVEEGDLGAQRTEALLQELAGLSLEEWVRRQFFPRHVRQFRYRPVAWHLASAPQGGSGKRSGARRQPAFECLVYYHACAGDVLARLRSHYLQPLILVEQRRAEEARRAGDETAAAVAAERITELEAFAEKLRQVDEEGFACQELDALVAVEPLDRWSGDGQHAPSDREELLRRERAWHVDTNDGVRVNMAPLQFAGVLAAEVLKAADARKAIADRARWRADERRWVREGKLPRCGWMGDDVPESPRWHELAPQREAERRKLEEKRGASPERLV